MKIDKETVKLLENQIKNLKKMISKMKSCCNCKYRWKFDEMELLDLEKDDLQGPCRTCNNHDKWEIPE